MERLFDEIPSLRDKDTEVKVDETQTNPQSAASCECFLFDTLVSFRQMSLFGHLSNLRSDNFQNPEYVRPMPMFKVSGYYACGLVIFSDEFHVLLLKRFQNSNTVKFQLKRPPFHLLSNHMISDIQRG